MSLKEFLQFKKFDAYCDKILGLTIDIQIDGDYTVERKNLDALVFLSIFF